MTAHDRTPAPQPGDDLVWGESRKQMRPLWNAGDVVHGRWFVHRVRPPSEMGVIYFCFDTALGIPVVAKTLPPRYIGVNQARRRFVDECKIWIALREHRNVVRAFYVESLFSTPYIFLEWVVGVDSYRSSVADWIERGDIQVEDAIRIGHDVCDAFIYVSNQLGGKFVHRDLKPSNILLNEHGVGKLTDFGLALAIQETEPLCEDRERPVEKRPALVRIGKVSGTPPYMAPEQCSPSGAVDSRTDIYAFGCVLFEMLTGRRLFDVSTQMEWLHAHQYWTPPSLEAVAKVPRYLSRVVAACLEKDPANRPQSFAEIRCELAPAQNVATRQPNTPDQSCVLVSESLNRGTSLDALGQPEEALKCYAEAERLVRGQRYETELHYGIAYNRAIALEHIGRFEDALLEWDRAIHWLAILAESGREWHGSMPASRARLLVEKSKTFNRMSRTENALALCREALRLEPALYEAVEAMAGAFTFAERWSEALDWLDQALEIRKNEPDVVANKALALCGLGREAEALEWYDRALAITGDHPKALYGKGTLFLKQRRFADAELWLRKAIVANPKDSFAWNHLGIVLLETGKPEAETCFAKALETDPNNISAQRNLAQIHARTFVTAILEAASEGGGSIDIPPEILTLQFYEALNGCLDMMHENTGEELFFIRRLVKQFEQVTPLLPSRVGVIVTVDEQEGGLSVNALVGYNS